MRSHDRDSAGVPGSHPDVRSLRSMAAAASLDGGSSSGRPSLRTKAAAVALPEEESHFGTLSVQSDDDASESAVPTLRAGQAVLVVGDSEFDGLFGRVTGRYRGRVGVALVRGGVVGVPACMVHRSSTPAMYAARTPDMVRRCGGFGTPSSASHPLSPVPPPPVHGRHAAPRRLPGGISVPAPPDPQSPSGQYHPRNSHHPGPAQRLVIEQHRERRTRHKDEMAERVKRLQRKRELLEEQHRRRQADHDERERAAAAERERQRREKQEEQDRARQVRRLRIRLPTPPESQGMRLDEVMKKRYQEQVEEPEERRREAVKRRIRFERSRASSHNADWNAAMERHRESYEAEMKLRAAAHRQELREQQLEWEGRLRHYERSALFDLDRAERDEVRRRREEDRHRPMEQRLRMEQYGALVTQMFSPSRRAPPPLPPPQRSTPPQSPPPVARSRSQQVLLGNEYLRKARAMATPRRDHGVSVRREPAVPESRRSILATEALLASSRLPSKRELGLCRNELLRQGQNNLRAACQLAKPKRLEPQKPNRGDRQRRHEKKARVIRALRQEAEYSDPLGRVGWERDPMLRRLAGGVVDVRAEVAVERLRRGDQAVLQGIQAKMSLLEDLVSLPAIPQHRSSVVSF